MAELEAVITESLEDATMPQEEPEVTPEGGDTPEPVETAPEPTSSDAEPVAETPEPETPTVAKPTVDEFEKKYGIPALSATGRENRIPYSRVKKINERAVGEIAEVALGRKLNPGENAIELVKARVSKLPELETENKTYKTQLERVAKFEDIMVNDSNKFLRMLSTLPAYREFFQSIEEAFANKQDPKAPAAPAPAVDDMPAPDQELPDGTRVYSMEGLKSLLAWQAGQVESRVTKQVEERYKPIETEWQAQQRFNSVVPQVQAQITKARTWDLFNENEEEIVKVLASDPQISLHEAYQQVVFPKLKADRIKMREELLAEIKKAPRSTAAPTTGSKAPQTTDGPKSIEDIIREQVKTLKR